MVFKFINNLIYRNIEKIKTNETEILKNKIKTLSKNLKKIKFIHNRPKELDSLSLRFLQLLCENHNRKLQFYLNFQKNFKKSYDLITATNNYLQFIFIKYDNPNYNNFCSLILCIDLLIEFIQGPCAENQKLLINSKLLITISEILKKYQEINLDNYENGEVNIDKVQTNSLFTYPQIAILVYKVSTINNL